MTQSLGVVEAGHNIHIRLHQADHLADADRGWPLAQTQPALSAAHRVDQPGNPKLMNHLHQMHFQRYHSPLRYPQSS